MRWCQSLGCKTPIITPQGGETPRGWDYGILCSFSFSLLWLPCGPWIVYIYCKLLNVESSDSRGPIPCSIRRGISVSACTICCRLECTQGQLTRMRWPLWKGCLWNSVSVRSQGLNQGPLSLQACAQRYDTAAFPRRILGLRNSPPPGEAFVLAATGDKCGHVPTHNLWVDQCLVKIVCDVLNHAQFAVVTPGRWVMPWISFRYMLVRLSCMLFWNRSVVLT